MPNPTEDSDLKKKEEEWKTFSVEAAEPVGDRVDNQVALPETSLVKPTYRGNKYFENTLCFFFFLRYFPSMVVQPCGLFIFIVSSVCMDFAL